MRGTLVKRGSASACAQFLLVKGIVVGLSADNGFQAHIRWVVGKAYRYAGQNRIAIDFPVYCKTLGTKGHINKR